MSNIDLAIAVLAVTLVVFTVVYNVKKGGKCEYCKECEKKPDDCGYKNKKDII